MSERTLKFRIYSFVDKAWHYFDIYEGYPQGIYGAVTPPQQFTGLTDENGKEIYEGDIVDIEYSTGHERDSFYDYSFSGVEIGFLKGCFILKKPKEYWFGYGDGHVCDWEVTQANDLYLLKYASVVGNIIENKELMNK